MTKHRVIGLIAAFAVWALVFVPLILAGIGGMVGLALFLIVTAVWFGVVFDARHRLRRSR